MLEGTLLKRNLLLIDLSGLVASWSAFTVIGEVLGGSYVLIPVPSSEDYTCYSAILSAGRTLSFFLMGSIGATILYLTFREVMLQPPETVKARRLRVVAEITFILFLFLFLGGLAMRYVANELHMYASLLPPSIPIPFIPQANVYFLVYFFDEVLGHKLIYLGVVGFIVSTTILQNYHGYKRFFTKKEYSAYGVLGFLFGAGIGVSSVEGQAAFEILVFSAASLTSFLILLATKRIMFTEVKGSKVRSNPFYAFSLLFFLGATVAIIACGAYFGIKPFYPFFTQPSEREIMLHRLLLLLLTLK